MSGRVLNTLLISTPQGKYNIKFSNGRSEHFEYNIKFSKGSQNAAKETRKELNLMKEMREHE